MAEDIHQQRVGTGTGIEFHPASPFVRGEGTSPLRMNLGESRFPRGICLDCAVAFREKVSMTRVVVVRLKAHGRGLAIAQAIRQRLSGGILLSAVSQVAAKRGGKTHPDFFSERLLSTTRAIYSATRTASCSAQRSAGLSLNSWSRGATIAAAAIRIALPRSCIAPTV